MARLTNKMRGSILRRALQDIPVKNYQEQANAIAQADVFSQIPHLEELVKKYPELFNRRLTKVYDDHGIYAPGRSIHIVTPNGNDFSFKKATQHKVKTLLDKGVARQNSIEKARDEVITALKSVTTTKRLMEAYPDLGKYIPEEEAKNNGSLVVPSSLPVLHSVGWKGKKTK